MPMFVVEVSRARYHRYKVEAPNAEAAADGFLGGELGGEEIGSGVDDLEVTGGESELLVDVTALPDQK